MADRLTPKQARFANAYLANGGNGTRAAEAAGYAGSYATLRSVASENLGKPDIALHLRARTEAEAVTPDRIIAEMARIAFMDDERCKVTEFDCNGNIKAERYVFTDKNTALANLARINGLFKERVDVTHDVVRRLQYLPPQGYALSATVAPAAAEHDDEDEDEQDATPPLV